MKFFQRLWNFKSIYISKNALFKLIPFIAASIFITQPTYSQTIAVWSFDSQEISQSANTSINIKATELENLLTESLQKLPSIKILDRIRLKEILDEQKLGSSDLADMDSRIRLGRIAGAGNMIFGSLTKIGDINRMDLRMVSVETTQIISTHESSGNNDTLIIGIDEFTKEIFNKLDNKNITQSSGYTRTPNPSATQSFEEGLTLMAQKKYLLAIESFKAALKKDPSLKQAEKQIQIASEKLSQE